MQGAQPHTHAAGGQVAQLKMAQEAELEKAQLKKAQGAQLKKATAEATSTDSAAPERYQSPSLLRSLPWHWLFLGAREAFNTRQPGRASARFLILK